jgi:hypothetical protein
MFGIGNGHPILSGIAEPGVREHKDILGFTCFGVFFVPKLPAVSLSGFIAWKRYLSE